MAPKKEATRASAPTRRSQPILTIVATGAEHDRVGEYEMKLMDIDQEHLGIPDTVYDAEIQIPAAEFARIIRDLKELGESVKIEVSKDGVRFSSEGDIGSAAVTLKQTSGAGKAASDDEEEDEEQEGSDEEQEEDDEEEPKEEEEEDVSLFGTARRSRFGSLAGRRLTSFHPSLLPV
jgi:proliferating cell nuclear antigen